MHRAELSRRGADDAEIARMTITYLVVRQPDGWRTAALLVHSAERTGPSPRGDGGAVGPT
ncbi:hypothetical protein Q9S36_44715 [Microbacterium sp. ARD31]|uniref:DUF6841 family protein n=1 Tax=Microbacterium sp. ARD31 TaxID=2962576 RepID=UPI002881857D|nr:hypothetical protein [Microbacterium sp. ARD31]MDT0187311.1 hypothetical protein [Microbacterium sp. ARD31]